MRTVWRGCWSALLRNKLFLFADVQANRIAYTGVTITTVPSLLERAGNFSELYNPTLTARSGPIQLYHQSSSAAPQPFPNNNLASGIPGVSPNRRAGGPQPASATEYQQRAAL